MSNGWLCQTDARLHWLFPAFLLAASVTLSTAAAQTDAPVFELPRKYQQVNQLRPVIHSLMRKQEYAQAEALALRTVELLPDDSVSYYNLACAEARQGKTQQAINHLDQAVALGFRGRQILLADADLQSLQVHRMWDEIVTRASGPPERRRQEITPGEIKDGVGLIEESNTVYDPRVGFLRVLFRRSAEETEELNQEAIVEGLGDTGELLRTWQEEGSVAGLTNVMYDNHDKDHSNMNYKAFPQLTRVEYCDAAKRAGLNNGLQEWFLFNGIVLGNSSTAVTGSPIWRSLTRLACSSTEGAAKLTNQYLNNHLYFYPEHRDYDVGHNGNGGYGDVFPANTPYVVTSQGSSGSDRAFLNAFTCTLAAMRPDVQQKLAQARMLMPTLQMIFRRCNRQVNDDTDYLSGKAHPVVFDGKQLRQKRMVRMAHDLTVDTLPPVARLRVVSEDQFRVGIDYFDVGPREQLFTTPYAVARIARAVQRERSIRLTAADSQDLNNRELTYQWVVLQGDPDRITITPLSPDSREVEITILHHERRPVQPGSKMETNRVDIGLFVSNGIHWSAPAFVSYYFPDNEHRVYDDEGRVQSVTWLDPASGGNYVDPLIVTSGSWRDEYTWKGEQPTGWIRWRGQQTERFTADGALVETPKEDLDKLGRPLKARGVVYEAVPRKNQPPILQQTLTREIRHYGYADESDFVGGIVRRSLAE